MPGLGHVERHAVSVERLERERNIRRNFREEARVGRQVRRKGGVDLVRRRSRLSGDTAIGLLFVGMAVNDWIDNAPQMVDTLEHRLARFRKPLGEIAHRERFGQPFE